MSQMILNQVLRVRHVEGRKHQYMVVIAGNVDDVREVDDHLLRCYRLKVPVAGKPVPENDALFRWAAIKFLRQEFSELKNLQLGMCRDKGSWSTFQLLLKDGIE